MTKNQIFKTLINILRSENLRTDMEFKPIEASCTIIEALRKTELKYVGIGMYSVVVEHDAYPGRVFKVSTSRWDGYREYAKYCIEHAGEELIPVVYSAKSKGNFAWYELQKYYPVTLPGLTKTGMVQYYNQKIRNITRVLQDSTDSYPINENYIEMVMSMKMMTRTQKKRHSTELIAFSEKAREIYKTFENQYRIDMHLGNIMMDFEGKRVVISDPLAANVRREIPVTEADPTEEDFA